jgi:transposase
MVRAGAADRACETGRAAGVTAMRAAADALFYLLRTGCPWRSLPRDGRFPPRSPVCTIFRGFPRDGVGEAIAATRVEAERRGRGREVDPSAGIRDSQTARAAERGARPDPVGYDAGSIARQVDAAVAAVPGLRIRIVKRSQPIGWRLLPRRWVIERTFAWFGRNRRLAKDYEGIVEAALAFLHLATIQRMIRRLARPGPPF